MNYDKALAIQPNDTNALSNKGVALYDLGKFREAIVTYDKVLALNPNDIYAINNKVNALGKIGKDFKIPRENLVSLAVYARAFYLCLCLGVFLFLYLSPQQFLLIGFAISMKDFKNKG